MELSYLLAAGPIYRSWCGSRGAHWRLCLQPLQCPGSCKELVGAHLTDQLVATAACDLLTIAWTVHCGVYVLLVAVFVIDGGTAATRRLCS